MNRMHMLVVVLLLAACACVLAVNADPQGKAARPLSKERAPVEGDMAVGFASPNYVVGVYFLPLDVPRALYLLPEVWQFTDGSWVNVTDAAAGNQVTIDFQSVQPVTQPSGGISVTGCACSANREHGAVHAATYDIFTVTFKVGTQVRVEAFDPFTLVVSGTYTAADCGDCEQRNITARSAGTPAQPSPLAATPRPSTPLAGPPTLDATPPFYTDAYVDFVDLSFSVMTADETKVVGEAATVAATLTSKNNAGVRVPVPNTPVTFVGASARKAGTRGSLPRAAQGLPNTVTTNDQGIASTTYTSTTAGPFDVTASIPSPFTGQEGQPLYASNVATTVWAVFDQILLQASAAHVACEEPVRLTAEVLNGNTPVRGVNVTFSISGNCLPFLSGVAKRWAITDAAGKASVEVASAQPGEVAVVAAAVFNGDTVVVSKAAHVAFESKASGHDGNEGHKRHHGWNAEYAEEATQQAKAMLASQPGTAAMATSKPQE